MASRKRTNIPGAAEQPLRSVKSRNKAGSYKVSSKSSEAASYNQIIKSVVSEIRAAQADSGNYSRDLLSKSIDNILDRIVFELDQREENQTFTDEQLEAIKEQVKDALSEQSLSYADMSAIKNDVVSIVEYFTSNSGSSDQTSEQVEKQESAPDKEIEESLTVQDETIDAKPGYPGTKYRNSTIAQDFAILQNFIDQQFRLLEKNLPVQIFPNMKSLLATGFGKVMVGVGSLTKGLTQFSKKTLSRVSSISKAAGHSLISGLSKTISGIGSGIKSVIGGIKGLGSKVSKAMASPFKAIGGFFARLNPFSRSKKADKAAEKKQSLRDKAMNLISKVVQKIWSLVEPFVNWLSKAFKVFVIAPIMAIALNVALIIGAIVLIAVLAYILIKKIIDKVKQFINYVKSGQMWKDIKEKILQAWGWLKDFGKWIWDKLKDFGNWLLDCFISGVKAIFVDFPIWIWEKLKEFGQWLYDTFIDPYIIKPLTKLIQPIANLWVDKIQPKIQPFIDSITNLKDRIVGIWQKFKWDENKSFFENLKCLASIVKDAVLDWWDSSPFKEFYEKYLDPIIKSVQDLIGRVKQIWQNFSWDENKSFLENLRTFWDQCWTSIKEWWSSSTIKTYWDKIVDWVTNIWQKIKDWWNSTSIGKWINNLQQRIEALKQKLSTVYIHIPVWDKNIYPFAPSVGKPFIVDGSNDETAKAMEETENRNNRIKELEEKLKDPNFKNEGLTEWGDHRQEKIDELNRLKAEQAAANKKQAATENAAASQVMPAIESLNQAQKAKQTANVELSKEAQLYSAQAAQKQQVQDQYSQNQDYKLNTILNAVNNINSKPNSAGINLEDVTAAAAAGGAVGSTVGHSWDLQQENR